MRLVILGFDGLTPELAFPWARAGLLPNLARLMEQGAWGPLRSVVHPITPAAWTSMLTGVNPGRHGVYDFGVRQLGSYELRLTDSRDIACDDIFDILSAHGLRVGAFNIPLSYPPRRTNGFMVTGMHTPTLDQGCWPPGLARRIREIRSDYRVDVMSYWYEDLQVFYREILGMLEARTSVALELWKRHRPDLFFAVFVAADRVQHALWRRCFPTGIPAIPFHGASAEILKIYQALDEALGLFLDELGEDETLMVVSDHGFGSLEKDVFLDRYLEVAGLLRFHRRGGRRGKGRITIRDIDWSRTRAYSYGLFGNIYLNQLGREPRGIVNPGRDREDTLEEVASVLHEIRDPDDGGRIVDHVLRGDLLYRGPATSSAPDLVVIMRDYAYITRGGREVDGARFVAEPGVNHTGNHRLDGVFGILGPQVRPVGKIGVISLMDIAPTALALLGLRSRMPLDGVVAKEILESCRSENTPIESTAEDRIRQPLQRVSQSEPDDRVLRDRLRAMGYLS